MNEKPVVKEADSRHATEGRTVPKTGSYADQPYLLKADDGAWVCSVTTSPGHEGERGQHIEVFRSTDCGRTWEGPFFPEPADAAENSYAVLLKAPSGRIFLFYNYNSRNQREVVMCDGPPHKRVDCLGDFVFRYSDDHGRTWSVTREVIPVRAFRCDLENPYGGEVRLFWNVGKPFVLGPSVYVPLIKVGRMTWRGFFAQSEGALLRSNNLLTENDPKLIRWETLPDGDAGLKAPKGGGEVAEEHSFVPLSDGTLYAVWRTLAGHPACARSFDGGRTWTDPDWQRFPDGRPMKNPRAANFVWKCSGGRYLYWFHNHGGHFIPAVASGKSADNGISLDGLRSPYDDRNPVWLCAGREVPAPDGRLTLEWSQPEIVLYEDDPLFVRMSYPDLLEEADGRLFVSETNKLATRIHELPPDLIDGMFARFDPAAAPPADYAAEWKAGEGDERLDIPLLPSFSVRDRTNSGVGSVPTRHGFSLEICADFEGALPGDRLLDTREDGSGFALFLDADGSLVFLMSDGRFEISARADAAAVASAGWHHLVLHVDGGPHLVVFTIDGRVGDGGTERQFGWSRFPVGIWNVTGRRQIRMAPRFGGRLRFFRLWLRSLRVSEAVALHRACTAVSPFK